MSIESRSPHIEQEPQSPNPERESQLIARVTFSRHEETDYTEAGRDITEAGEARAREKGRTITREKGAPVLFGHSPKPRAKGTAEAIEEGVKQEIGESKARWMRVPGLHSTEFREKGIMKELVDKYGADIEAWAQAHYDDPAYYDNPESIETNEEKRTRMYRELDRLIGFLEKHDSGEEVPHLVFVSHYELLTLLLDDVFGIKTFETAHKPGFGEHIDIDLYKPLPTGEVPVRISFEGHEQRVLFDRKMRRLVAEPST